MRVLVLDDNRIKAKSILIEMKIADYLELAKEIYNKNEYQRRRVKSSSSVYSLLKDDLKTGCIIPPIVLALSNGTIDDYSSDDVVLSQLKVKKTNLLILDGLQRTHQIITIEKEYLDSGNDSALEVFQNYKIRTEIYVGINKIGILYRMLTLNTGQTPMSLRHQIEILYSDYLGKEIEGIKLIREVDETQPYNSGEYKFKDVIDGFKSYIERNELPISRLDLLENIKGLEKLSKENQDTDLFKNFVVSFNMIVSKFDQLATAWEYDNGDNPAELSGQAFGTNILKIFTKPMVLTGYGAAIGKLIDFSLISDFNEVNRISNDIKFKDHNVALPNLLKKLDSIKLNAPKIGNAQRMYFQFFFRELFNKDSDSYQTIDDAVDNAYQKYLTQTA